jgi:hypothetical protein
MVAGPGDGLTVSRSTELSRDGRSIKPDAASAARRSPARLAKIIWLVGLCAAGMYVCVSRWGPWDRVGAFGLGFAIAIFVAVVRRGRMRNVAVFAASIALSLTVAEGYGALVSVSASAIDINTPGYSGPNTVLGWGPQRPGVFHHQRIDGRTGRILRETDYTIDATLHRRVISATTGPTVAFFGDSMTFGSGVSDADTLPQAFADATGRELRVLNLAFPGYGPQQFLRALETDLYRDLLVEPRLFVILTAPWHAERASCAESYMLRAPRYELIDGQPNFSGVCARNWRDVLSYPVKRTAIYNVFLRPLLGGARPADIDLYITMLVRAGQLARAKYGVPTLVLYMPDDWYLRPIGVTDQQIMQRLREAGLLVVDAGLDPKNFPGQALAIPNDGHPTGVANRARAILVRDALAALVRQTQ